MHPNIIHLKMKSFGCLSGKFHFEGLDQTRGWFYTLTVLGTHLFKTAPYQNVIVTGIVLAADGKKMSKRLKNYPTQPWCWRNMVPMR